VALGSRRWPGEARFGMGFVEHHELCHMLILGGAASMSGILSNRECMRLTQNTCL